MHKNLKDLSDKKFNRLRVISINVKDKRGEYSWNCVCDCGNKTTVLGGNLRSGNTQSCGCLQKERTTKHSMHKHPAYWVWIAMKQRCGNPKCKAYKNYGGRGIVICERWLESFNSFWEDMGSTWRRGLSIDRINNDGNYEPENCRWATSKQQNNNQRKEYHEKTNNTQ